MFLSVFDMHVCNTPCGIAECTVCALSLTARPCVISSLITSARIPGAEKGKCFTVTVALVGVNVQDRTARKLQLSPASHSVCYYRITSNAA